MNIGYPSWVDDAPKAVLAERHGELVPAGQVTLNGVPLGRAAIADWSRRVWDAAVAACGPGHAAYACWRLEDNLGLEPTRIAFCRPGESGGWTPTPAEAFGDLVNLTSPRIRFQFKGDVRYGRRYTTCFSHVPKPYQPKTVQKLDQIRERREAAKAERERAATLWGDAA